MIEMTLLTLVLSEIHVSGSDSALCKLRFSLYLKNNKRHKIYEGVFEAIATQTKENKVPRNLFQSIHAII